MKIYISTGGFGYWEYDTEEDCSSGSYDPALLRKMVRALMHALVRLLKLCVEEDSK